MPDTISTVPLRSSSRRAVSDFGSAGRERGARWRPSNIGNLFRRDLNAAGLRIFVHELRAEKTAQVLDVAASPAQCFALHEILHRVGGDQAEIVAMGVGGPERVAIDQDFHVGAERGTCAAGCISLAMQAIDRNVALSVVASLVAAGETVPI